MQLTEQDRQILEEKYGALSDKRWNIIVAELEDVEDEAEAASILADVLAHFEDYEKEYDLWEEIKSSDKSPETLRRLIEKYK